MSIASDELVPPAFGGSNPALDDDRGLALDIAAAVQAAGARMAELFDTRPRYTTRDEVVAAIHANDEHSLAVFRPMLDRLRPNAGWVDDELESGALPPGEWWVTDPVEGNINHVPGTTDWFSPLEAFDPSLNTHRVLTWRSPTPAAQRPTVAGPGT